jgi:hypothetical protein
MIDIALAALLVTFSAVGLTIIVRNAPIIRGWVQEAKRPWACNVCMPVYACVPPVAALVYLHGVSMLLTYLPAYALSHIVLERLSDPPNEPFIPPSFSEVE